MTTDKQIEVIEGNKLIAEFVGLKIRGVQCNGPFDPEEWDIEIDAPDFISERDLDDLYSTLEGPAYYYPTFYKFHTSWDWLMPVVKKIRNYLDNELVRPSKNHCCKGDEIEIDIHCHMTTTNIEGVWETVVKFIIWYNQHSKPQTI